MHAQTRVREERLAAVLQAGDLVTGVVAVVAGAGNRELFESFVGSQAIEGGATMNPSTAAILEAIRASPAGGVIVLPNNANTVLGAEQAAAHADKPVVVIPSRSLPSGLAAIGAFLSNLPLEENEARMKSALSAASTGEVARASRDAEVDGLSVREGDWLGLVDGRAAVTGPDFETVALDVVERALGGERSVVTLITGEDELDGADLLERVRERHPHVDAEQHRGGQPHYALYVLAE
jgi:dihydroxyacetone kinase-like predicted kinase